MFWNHPRNKGDLGSVRGRLKRARHSILSILQERPAAEITMFSVFVQLNLFTNSD